MNARTEIKIWRNCDDQLYQILHLSILVRLILSFIMLEVTVELLSTKSLLSSTGCHCLAHVVVVVVVVILVGPAILH